MEGHQNWIALLIEHPVGKAASFKVVSQDDHIQNSWIHKQPSDGSFLHSDHSKQETRLFQKYVKGLKQWCFVSLFTAVKW